MCFLLLHLKRYGLSLWKKGITRIIGVLIRIFVSLTAICSNSLCFSLGYVNHVNFIQYEKSCINGMRFYFFSCDILKLCYVTATSNLFLLEIYAYVIVLPCFKMFLLLSVLFALFWISSLYFFPGMYISSCSKFRTSFCALDKEWNKLTSLEK